MFISQCLENPDFIFLRCSTEDRNIVECICAKSNSEMENKKLSYFETFQNLFYENDDLNGVNAYSSENNAHHVVKCFKKYNGVSYTCSTFENTKNKSICHCHDAFIQNNYFEYIPTIYLYKNLENIFFDTEFDVIEYKNESKSKKIEQHQDKIKIHMNNLFNSLIEAENLDHLENEYSFLIIFCFLFLFFLLIIYRFIRQNMKKKTKYEKFMYYKK